MWSWRFIRISVISRVLHGCPLNSNVSDEAFEVVEGADDIRFSITGAISPWSRWTRVEVESQVLLVLDSRLLGKLIIALEEIVVATP